MSGAHWREAINESPYVAVAAVVKCSPALAQTTTLNVVTPTPGLQTPLTFTATTCMMNCNSQVADCQTRCFVQAAPVPPMRQQTLLA